MTTPRASAIPSADAVGQVLLLVPVACSALLVSLLPPITWKVQLTMAAAAAQVAGFYLLARTGALRRSPLDAPALAFLAVAVAATLLSVDRQVSFYPSPLRGDGLLVYIAYVLAGLGAARLSFQQRKALLWGMLGSGSVVALVALGQYYGTDQLPWMGFQLVPPQAAFAEGTSVFAFEPIGPGGRSLGTLGQSMFLGALTVLLLPVAVASAVTGSRRGARLFSAASAVLLCGGLVASQSRTAWIAAVASGAFLVVLLPKGRIVWARLAALAVVLAAVTVVMGATRPQTGLARRAISVVGEVQHADRSLGQRLYMWTQTLQLIRQRPTLGWGFSTLLSRFPGYGTPEYRRRFGEEVVELIDNPHNEFLSVAFSTGLVGLTAYLWVWAAAVSGAIRGWRGRREAGNLSGAVLAALLAYFIWMQTAWSHIGVANLLWVILGVAAASPAGGDIPGTPSSDSRYNVQCCGGVQGTRLSGRS